MDHPIRIEINKKTQYRVTLTADDKRTGNKKGTLFEPKGVYFHKGNCILVGSRTGDHVTRLSFKESIVYVEIEP